MENNVVTLDTAKKLKAAGFPQGTQLLHIYRWTDNSMTERPPKFIHQLIRRGDRRLDGFDVYAAPTAQEIADQLPAKSMGGYLRLSRSNTGWIAGYGLSGLQSNASTMVEALALLWLKLQEDK